MAYEVLPHYIRGVHRVRARNSSAEPSANLPPISSSGDRRLSRGSPNGLRKVDLLRGLRGGPGGNQMMRFPMVISYSHRLDGEKNPILTATKAVKLTGLGLSIST
jgi:hypothetical protein